jgi:lipopolysaccharide/colanic/teichoic acid biosynthesis glycosyltransferase
VFKRFTDIVASALGLLFLALPFAAMAAWIKLDSRGPVFFRQVRVGRFGVGFRIFKFRTMQIDAERTGMQLTVGADVRITRVGVFLRRYKLDELPQLLNVLTGDMSMVGPRPEVPRYVATYPPEVRDIVLSVRPGITDLASIAFRNENQLLSKSVDPERTYVEEIIPIKLRYYLEYVSNRSAMLDLKIALLTLRAVISTKE